MGIVYEATDVRLTRKVAIKVLPHGQASDEGKRRFLLEAQAASRLNHPNIVTIHDLDSADGVDFIVMEHVDGRPLHQAIGGEGLPLDRVLDYARQLASALAAAHGAGIVHRDLKPSNIMVARDGRLKILDFGLSKLMRPEPADTDPTRSAGPATVRGMVLGTPGYMSPEQAMGEVVDARSDVFSLGVVFFEMAAGTLPFARDDLRGLLHGAPKSLLESRPDVPPAFAALVTRCLEKAPENRYSSAVELQRDLERISAIQQAAPTRSRPSRAVVAGAMLLVLAAVATTAWFFTRRTQLAREHQASVDRVEQLVDTGRFVDVWRLAGPALQRWPDDTRLQRALQSSTHVVTIATDPTGADVLFKAYDDVDGDWIRLGTTPLEAVRAPLGMLRWRIVKTGFEPIEARLEVGVPAAAAGRPDFNARPIRLYRPGEGVPGAVFVPGGESFGQTIADYWIDRTEVTNRAFKAFVDRGGYEDPAFWTELERSTRARGRNRVGAERFRDRTGRPGPATWELGSYPEGQDDYPVRGVSWFEAAAYCASTQRRLPTIYHWGKALGATFFMEVVTLGNFSGRGPEAVGRLKDLGPYGTYGLAGNVKEWVWNEFEGQRYLLGGAWNEPVYMATVEDARPPFDRAETHGVRCMKETSASAAAVYEPWILPGGGTDAPAPKPVSDVEFRAFRRFYEYDRGPLDSRLERSIEGEHWRRERVSFRAAYGGERVLVNILVPKNAKPPYQAVIWFPGSYARELRSTEGDLPFSLYFDFIARSGRVLVYPVYSDTYERLRPETSEVHASDSLTARDRFIRWAKDVSRTIDYLESRDDIDSRRIGYYGYSMGAIYPLAVLGVERRLKTAVLLSGGLALGMAPEVAPQNFLPRADLPVLMLGGRYDFNVPIEAAQKPLFELFGTPAEHKRMVVFEDAGHVPPRLEVIREVLDWLDRYLGPVQR